MHYQAWAQVRPSPNRPGPTNYLLTRVLIAGRFMGGRETVYLLTTPGCEVTMYDGVPLPLAPVRASFLSWKNIPQDDRIHAVGAAHCIPNHADLPC